jgi:recombination protein RecA
MSSLLKLVAPPLARAPLQERPWSYAQLAGRLTELSSSRAGAQLTFAVALVLEAQREHEPAAWLSSRDATFFPPDAQACGVDLAALAVVRLDAPQELGRAADQLLRSGAFGLIVLELGANNLPVPLVTRLLGLAQKHSAALLFLTTKPREAPSLSPLISLRAEVSRTRRAEGKFLCELHALKDKRRAPGWTHHEECRGPAGLR